MIAPPRTIACFGEIVMRVSIPEGELPLQSAGFGAHAGGAEANVAVALAALGRRTAMISAVPEGPIGDGVMGELRRHGVDTASVRRPAGRMGLYYHLPGGSMRPAEVVYDRAGSAFALAGPEEWDWDHLLDGAGWLHVSGVTPALEHIASTAREIIGPDAHRITARVDTRDERGASDPILVTPVIDRVGTGDAFAAGVLDGLWSGKNLTDAAKHGLALAALKHGIHGDFAPFSRSMLDRVSSAAQDISR